jgi:NADPH:quinone reductase-like Zn-dependent oxidoreductase
MLPGLGRTTARGPAAPLVTITAWEAQRERARVHQGQHVLVQGGAGGVGHMSVQIARMAGARVATTVTPGPKQELASSLGALTACFSLVRPYGDLVSNVESPWEDEAVTLMQQRSLRVSFAWMPAPSVFGWPDQRERQRGILEQAAAHFDAGDLRVQVGATFPLEQAAEAHRASKRAGDRQSGPHHVLALSSPFPCFPAFRAVINTRSTAYTRNSMITKEKLAYETLFLHRKNWRRGCGYPDLP